MYTKLGNSGTLSMMSYILKRGKELEKTVLAPVGKSSLILKSL